MVTLDADTRSGGLELVHDEGILGSIRENSGALPDKDVGKHQPRQQEFRDQPDRDIGLLAEEVISPLAYSPVLEHHVPCGRGFAA